MSTQESSWFWLGHCGRTNFWGEVARSSGHKLGRKFFSQLAMAKTTRFFYMIQNDHFLSHFMKLLHQIHHIFKTYLLYINKFHSQFPWVWLHDLPSENADLTCQALTLGNLTVENVKHLSHKLVTVQSGPGGKFESSLGVRGFQAQVWRTCFFWRTNRVGNCAMSLDFKGELVKIIWKGQDWIMIFCRDGWIFVWMYV